MIFRVPCDSFRQADYCSPDERIAFRILVAATVRLRGSLADDAPAFISVDPDPAGRP